ncbi:hypothetical protein L1049_011345 [Liquidambar formosana]|uniref:Glycoside hydrolase family 3 N-terminal domain-containing protein n=1 Tax=Liquidambar formosana TaxID=63359 RepID=A0AAP0RWT7_LIQFO
MEKELHGRPRDPDLVHRIGAATALEVRATGIHHAYSPVVAVTRDPRWGRCYESYSEETEIVTTMTTLVSGLQGAPKKGHLNGYPFVAGRDPNLVQRIGAATALEVRATGIHCTYGPVVAVIRDPRWGRCYESFSEDTDIVRSMTTIVSGLQGVPHKGHPNGYPFVAGRYGRYQLIIKKILST